MSTYTLKKFSGEPPDFPWYVHAPSSVLGKGTNITSKILSLQSKEVPNDVYWVNVKVLATLILMCDHSPQHTNGNKMNVVYICCSVLTILDVLKCVTQLWQIPTFVL